MIVRCNQCQRVYNDAEQWTLCPHTPLGYPVDGYCPQCDTLRSVHGPCRHQAEAPVKPEPPKLLIVCDWCHQEKCNCRTFMKGWTVAMTLIAIATLLFFIWIKTR